jgi:hypothetical protein
MARLLFDDDQTPCRHYINTQHRRELKSSRPLKNSGTASPLISDSHHLRPLLKPGVMADLNLVDPGTDLISNHILKSTLLPDQALRLLMSMITVMHTDILTPKLQVMQSRVTRILTVKRIMDMITDLPAVMIMDIRMVVAVATRTDR